MQLYKKIKLDANHRQICDHLRANGVWVWELLNPVDCVIQLRQLCFMEIKIEKGAQCTRQQLDFIAGTPAPVAFVENEAQALDFARTGIGLSQSQKDKIAFLLMKEPDRKKFEYGQIKKLIEVK